MVSLVLCNLHWEYFLFVTLLWFRLIIAEHEDVSPNGVSMHVAEEKDVTAF